MTVNEIASLLRVCARSLPPNAAWCSASALATTRWRVVFGLPSAGSGIAVAPVGSSRDRCREPASSRLAIGLPRTQLFFRRAADGCIAPMIRKPIRASPT